MAGLIFDDYIVSEASFKKNEGFRNQNNVNLSTEFQCHIKIKQEIFAIVQLSCLIGDIEDENTPFEVRVVIKGNFEYNKVESEGLSFEDYLTTNAIAILFPYVRAVVSDLTSKSNEFPTLNLPVINVAKMLRDNNLIKVFHEKN